jgi:flagellar basal-body rod modification protein FlgD
MQVNAKATGQTSSESMGAGMLSGGSDAFMTLLMAQLKSQDPMSPMDTNQFVTQLVQFNTLNEITKIRELVSGIMPTSGS